MYVTTQYFLKAVNKYQKNLFYNPDIEKVSDDQAF